MSGINSLYDSYTNAPVNSKYGKVKETKNDKSAEKADKAAEKAAERPKSAQIRSSAPRAP